MGHIQVQVCENKLGQLGSLMGTFLEEGRHCPGSLIIRTDCSRFFPFCYMTVQCTRAGAKCPYPAAMGVATWNDFNQWNVSRHHPLGNLLRCSRELWLIFSMLRAALPGEYECGPCRRASSVYCHFWPRNRARCGNPESEEKWSAPLPTLYLRLTRVRGAPGLLLLRPLPRPP